MSNQPSTINQKPLAARENEVLVRVEGVSKKFCRDLKKSLWYGVKDVASELFPFSSNKKQAGKNKEFSSELRPGEFWANKDISFELRRGECLGLIGRNGAGKTTLLRMLNGLIKPDSGTIEMYGRVGALIALGAGFNPILTGRENIYVNGAILGLSKQEIDDKIEDITAFAEIPEFIDSPVQSYSSGMQVRLGFAVATALEPDILILDEVLAVGDATFRAKCFNRVRELLNNAAVIFVSHQMSQVARMCTNGIYLKQGRNSILGTKLDEAIASYEADCGDNEGGSSISTKDGKISGVLARLNQDKSATVVSFSLNLRDPSQRFTMSLVIVNMNADVVATAYSLEKNVIITQGVNDQTYSFEISNECLHPGTYKLQIGILAYPDDTIIARSVDEALFNIAGSCSSPVSSRAIVSWSGV